MPDACTTETVIDLLRHGEPVGGSRYRGQQDDELSEQGWQQMWSALDGSASWQQIVSSPLIRCHAFASELAKRHGIPLHSETGFAEVGFGAWEGRTRAELEQLDPGQVARFLTDPVAHRPPGAEPLEAFVSRVNDAFGRMVERYAGQSVLVVAHAGVIRAIIAGVLNMPPAAMYRIHVANAGITRLRTDSQRGFSLLAHGVT
ncbi:MAG: alpha-ribazole phosphatase family protein [Gammaproteobacteria bacterium]|nr:alpha-ribazole phosphatase family protein [Gammaproteobacteria bacterium]